MTFWSDCSPAFYRIANLKNFKSHKNAMKSFFKIKTFKSHKKVMESFFGIKNFKTAMVSFFSIENFKSRKAVMEFFLSFRSFKSRKEVTESFFSGHASLRFHMMHKFPGTIFSVSSHWTSLIYISFFGYIFLTIHFNLHEERCRAHFSKYCESYFPTTQINGFTYIMSEAVVPSFPSYSCLEHFPKYRRKSPYVSNDCQTLLLTGFLCLLIQLIN